MTTASKDRAFLDKLDLSSKINDAVSDSTAGLLETAIDWIKNNLEPIDVFSERDLETWAENNGFIRSET